MMQKITKNLFKALLMAVLVSVNLLAFGGGRMKDIELDPGKNDNHGDMMKVFPTIASSQATVHFYFATDDMVTLSLYDQNGRLAMPSDHGFVPKLRTHEDVIDLTGVANGTYFLKLSQANGKTLTTKIVVQH